MSNYTVSLVFDLEGAEKAHSLDINGSCVHFSAFADSYTQATEIIGESISHYEKLGITFECIRISVGKEVPISICTESLILQAVDE